MANAYVASGQNPLFVAMQPGQPAIDVRTYGADPTGVADSTSAIQQAINVANVNRVAVYFPIGTFRLSAANSMSHCLTIPINTPGAWGLRMVGEGWGDGSIAAGGSRTTLFASTTCKSLLNVVATDVRIDGLKLEGGGLATNGMYLQGASNSKFNVAARGCLSDGIRLVRKFDGTGGGSAGVDTNNDNCTFHQSWGTQCGQVRATSGIVAQYGTLGAVAPAIIAGTVATMANNAVLNFSGTPDLTTLGLRVGDIVRIGAALDATTQFYQSCIRYSEQHRYGRQRVTAATVQRVGAGVRPALGRWLPRRECTGQQQQHAGRWGLAGKRVRGHAVPGTLRASRDGNRLSPRMGEPASFLALVEAVATRASQSTHNLMCVLLRAAPYARRSSSEAQSAR